MKLIDSHTQLLKGVMFDKVIAGDSYLIAQSFIKQDRDWNQIIPLTTLDILDSAPVDLFIDEAEADGWYFSFYVQETLLGSYTDMLSKTGYDFLLADTYIGCMTTEAYPATLGEGETFGEITETELDQYVELNKQAFDGWENAEEYTRKFFGYGLEKEGKQLRNFMIKKDEDVISFGSVIYSPELNIAYLHNSGTNPKYLRQGYFSLMNKLTVNYLLEQGITNVYAIVEEGGKSQQAFTKLGFEFQDRYHIYSNR